MGTAILAALLTLFGWREVEQGRRDLGAVSFQREALAIESAIRQRAEHYVSVLRAGQGLMQGSAAVTPAEWQNFADTLEISRRFPGIRALVFFERVSDDRLDILLNQQTLLWERTVDLDLPAGFVPRGEHYVATLVAPPGSVDGLLGVDLAGETVRRVTAGRARDTGRIAMTPLVTLVANGSGHDVVIMAPVYTRGRPLETVAQRRAALHGLVAVGYDAREILENAIGGETPDLRVRVYDRPEGEAVLGGLGRLIHASGPEGEAADALLTHRAILPLGQREWLLEISAGEAAVVRLGGGPAAPLLLIVGLAASLLLGLLVWMLVHRRQQAQELADRMTAALQQSEERYRQLFVANRAVELLIDPAADGRIVDANQAAARFYGWTIDQLRGMSIAEINTLSQDEVAAEMASATSERRDHFLFRHRLANGELRDVEVHSGPVLTGDRYLLYSIIHDVTERRRAEAALGLSEARFRALFEDSPLAIQILDPDGRTVRVNGAWRQLWQHGDGDNPLDDPQLRRAGVVDLLCQAFAGEVVEVPPFRYHLPDGPGQGGGFSWIRGYAYPIRDPDGRGHQLIVVWENVTEKLIQEERLRDTMEELERSNAELEQFAYVASHDLQEPLRMISSYIGLLKRRYGDGMTGEALEFMEFAVDGAHRMQDIINDLLTYSRVGRMGRPFAPCALDEIVAVVLEILAVVIRDAGAEVTVDGPLPVVDGDPHELGRLFQNLIGNAVKYHRPDVPPVVRIACARDGETWMLSVTDNGIGVAPEFHDRIFQIFQRLHSREEYGGTGVGLAICKKIVERHGGRIGIASGVGQGARFWFTLPVLSETGDPDAGADGPVTIPASS